MFDEDEKESRFGGFAWRTTIHGLHYIFWRYSTCRRVIWLLLFLAAVAAFVYTSYIHILFYLTYPKTTEVVPIDVLKMPDTRLTLCNMNALSQSRLASANLYNPLANLLSTGKVSDSSKPLDQISAEEFWKTMSQPQDEFILSCSWKGKSCPADSWSFSGSMNGACYTFTPSEVIPFSTGLSLTLNLATDDVVAPLAEDTGITVFLHPEDRHPLQELSHPDLYLASGFHTRASVKNIEVQRLAPPYGICGEIGKDCLGECYSLYLQDMCACVPYFMQSNSENGNVCNTTAGLLCASKAITENEMPCKCPHQCNDMTYDVSMSQTRLTDAKLLRSFDLSAFKSSDNVAQLTITGQQMASQRDVASYTVNQLMKDMALNLLIFLGASVLSCIEILDLLFELCCKCIRRK